MSKLLDSDKFWENIYDRFPETYKRDDSYTRYSLKRFIKTAGEGFKVATNEINGITNLRDSANVDSKFLYAVYKNHGMELFNGLPEEYIRNLVNMINPSFSRKGSISSIEYLCSVISGIVCEVDLSRFDDNNKVNLIIDMDFDQSAKFPNMEQLKRVVKEFLPFYCNISYVLTYSFYDSTTLAMSDSRSDIVVHQGIDEISSISFIETKQEDVSQIVKPPESGIIDRDTLGKSNYYLNSPFLKLNEGIILNSYDGYDIITVNGISTKVNFN